MNLKDQSIIPDTEIFALRRVSRNTGRERTKQLEAEGRIQPLRTPTGRVRLTYEDAERLEDAL